MRGGSTGSFSTPSFTDLVMPRGMSGVELARQACRIRPGLAVLLTTGYALRQGAGLDEFPVIAKPFRLAALSEAVGRLVNKTCRSTTIPGGGAIGVREERSA
jgi:DNA-binding LytR/AlgR family response regulator